MWKKTLSSTQPPFGEKNWLADHFCNGKCKISRYDMFALKILKCWNLSWVLQLAVSFSNASIANFWNAQQVSNWWIMPNKIYDLANNVEIMLFPHIIEIKFYVRLFAKSMAMAWELTSKLARFCSVLNPRMKGLWRYLGSVCRIAIYKYIHGDTGNVPSHLDISLLFRNFP